jgi:hypothetical protein
MKTTPKTNKQYEAERNKLIPEAEKAAEDRCTYEGVKPHGRAANTNQEFTSVFNGAFTAAMEHAAREVMGKYHPFDYPSARM